jgi:hypothetical protein
MRATPGGSALARDRDLAREVARAPVFAVFARDLPATAAAPSTLAPARYRALARDPACANDLARDRDVARGLTLALDRASRGVIRGRREAPRVAPAAGRLVAAAARLLPERERAQYTEEFLSELWEIAHVGGRRRAQLAYAARQVSSARRLRAELRVPQRRGAAP